ncbi:MAG: PQQ-binding-like beta-propeller repeat protein, partial [Planctomycetales bacterium]
MSLGILGLDRARSADPAQGSAAANKQMAKALVRRADIPRGVCAVLGSDNDLPIELAKSSELLIHVREPDLQQVLQLRKAADEAQLGIERLVSEQGRLDKLPYADNLLDVVISVSASKAHLKSLSLDEILRSLRPQGVAIIGQTGPQAEVDELLAWARAGNGEQIESWQDELGVWVAVRKAALEGADDWSHWEKEADNNPVSADTVIRAPYLTQFMAGPFYIGMPSVTTAAGGRTFLAIGHIAHHRREWENLNKLVARNGYNGTVLWERQLPKGYLVHRSAFVATENTFYMIDGDRCLLLDARTGKEKGEIRIPGLNGQWKWMAIKDGILYVLAGEAGSGAETTKGDKPTGGWSWADLSKGYYGKRIPHGFGDSLAAYDLAEQKLLWLHKEEILIDSRGMSIGGDKLFLYCPEGHFRSLAIDTGEIIWTNLDKNVLELIEQPGRGLRSTPGWRTQTMTLATPDALVVQGQTRMNVVALSTQSGSLLWNKKKVTNKPNAIYVDGKVLLGVGPGGSQLVIDPVSGEVDEDLKFRKTACTRLTASTDSFFCRGEGLMRFDRVQKKVMVDGAARPACNDVAIPATGMLYIGPWSCDCNLSLIGCIAKCSAGDFRFDIEESLEERTEYGREDIYNVEPLEVSQDDWPTYRANNYRSAGTSVTVPTKPSVTVPTNLEKRWAFAPKGSYAPTAPTAAGGLVFVAGDDGKARAVDAESGETRWQFSTPGAIKYPPTIWEGRAYFGSGDGHVYCVEAATGELLWRFRAAPVERHIMVYGLLGSTWPVSTGVLVHDGAAYFAAGIIDSDGTYVYKLDARTGAILWQNSSSGHLNKELRKGVSAQGNLSIQGNHLLLAGGNQISPASFDLATGECLVKAKDEGRPQANGGRFVGVLNDELVVVGGRVLYSAQRNVATKGYFETSINGKPFIFNYGGIPPAWNEKTLALVNSKNGKIFACDPAEAVLKVNEDDKSKDKRFWGRNLLAQLKSAGALRWKTDLDQPLNFEAVSLAVTANIVVAVVQYQDKNLAHPRWYVAG